MTSHKDERRLVQRRAASLFPCLPPRSEAQIDCAERPVERSQGGQQLDPDYMWRIDLVRSMHIAWNLKVRAIMLSGPKGAGKTSVVEQWHAKLGLPLYVVNFHDKTVPADFFGQWVPNNKGGLDWRDGPLVRAAREGCSVLINEINAARPGVTIAMNDIAQQGSIITIPETGEILEPKPGFRIYATKNPEGSLYAGRMPMDASSVERWFHILVDWMAEADEVEMIARVLRSHPPAAENAEDLAKKVVAVASAVRMISMETSDRPDAIPETMSHRVTRAWARYWCAMEGQRSSVHRGLEAALTNACDPVVQAAIHQFVSDTFGAPRYPQVEKAGTKLKQAA